MPGVATLGSTAVQRATANGGRGLDGVSYSLFTPPTRTRQNCLVLSMWAMGTEVAIKQDSFVLSRPSFYFATPQSQKYWGLGYWKLGNWKLGRDKTKDKTVLSCPCRRCEQAIWQRFLVVRFPWSAYWLLFVLSLLW